MHVPFFPCLVRFRISLDTLAFCPYETGAKHIIARIRAKLEEQVPHWLVPVPHLHSSPRNLCLFCNNSWNMRSFSRQTLCGVQDSTLLKITKTCKLRHRFGIALSTSLQFLSPSATQFSEGAFDRDVSEQPKHEVIIWKRY